MQSIRLSDSEFEENQGEDCLYLSIYSPAKTMPTSITNLTEVIVHFHGGAYNRGDKSIIDGAALAFEQNFVVVSVNFRQGPLGFWNIRCNETSTAICTSNNEYPIQTNWAIRDQLLALDFIYENIENFGGNPEKITLAGCGSGGEAIIHHILNGRSKYIKQAISWSSTFGIPLELSTTPKGDLFQYGLITNELECCVKGQLEAGCLLSGHQNHTCLQEKTTEQILTAAYHGFDQTGIPYGPFPSLIQPFRPVADKTTDKVVTGDAFLLLKQSTQLQDTKFIFEVTGYEGQKYLESFLEIIEETSISFELWDQILTIHFKETCISRPKCETLKADIMEMYPCASKQDCSNAAALFFNDLLWTCNQRSLLNEMNTNAFGVYQYVDIEEYECPGEFLLFGYYLV